MTIYQLDASSLQGAYDILKGVSTTCRDDDFFTTLPQGEADSYISNCDLAKLTKEEREKIIIELKDAKGGAKIFARSDEMLKLIYSKLIKLDEGDGLVDGRVSSKSPLSIEAGNGNWAEIERSAKSSVVGVELTLANGAIKASSAFVVGREEVLKEGRKYWRYTAWTTAHGTDEIYKSERDLKITLFNDEEVHDVKTIGVDHATDFGVIEFYSETELAVVKLGDSDKINPLDETMTLGNRLGEGIAGTQGQVVAIKIGASGFYKFDIIKVNDASTSGDSGGPVLNSKGEVIGILFMVEKGDKGGNLSMLIPVNRAKLAAEIISGKTEYAYAGIRLDILDSGVRKSIGRKTGVFVSSVDENSPASKAGIQSGDIILKVDGESKYVDITHPTKLYLLNDYIMTGKKPGDVLKLTVWRNGKEVETDIKLSSQSFGRINAWQTRHQFTAVELNSEIRDFSKARASGIFVELDGNDKYTTYGLPANSIVTHVGDKPVTSVEEFKIALTEAEERLKGKGGRIILKYTNTVWSPGTADSTGYAAVPVE